MHPNFKRAEFGRWKVWVIQCIAVANRFGHTPMPAAHLHVLLYLANTLATFFGVEPVRGRVLKRGNLPFYPDIQFEIDRLAYCGVLKIDSVLYGPKNHLAAFYDLGPTSNQIRTNLNKDPDIQELTHLFEELISASCTGFLSNTIDIGKIDANYADTQVIEGNVVDFSEWESSNYNRAVATYMLNQLSSLEPNYKRDGVRLYCDYLDEALTEND